MEPKVFRLAFVAAICVTIISCKSYACQSPAPLPHPAPVAPVISPAPLPHPAPVAPVISLAPLVSLVGTIADGVVNNYMATNNSSKRKMQQLQKQIQKLNEEITTNANEAASFYSQQAEEMVQDLGKNYGRQTDQNIDLDNQVAMGAVKVKSKIYSKSYPVDDNDKLQIDNHYGNVTVNTWAKNEFKVDVEVKAYANDDADAQKMLDQVKINDRQNNSVIAFTTVIGGNNTKSIWGALTTVRKTVINYTVYMPAKNPLTITNSYGAVVLPDLSGKVTIKSSYSNLTSKALTNTGNAINIKYGNADMESLVGSSLQLAYGDLNLQWADNLNADLSYSGGKIGKISNSANINIEYGDGLQIGSLDKNLKNLAVNAAYTRVKIGTANSSNTNFDVTVHYGDFSFDNGVSVTKSTADKNNWQTSQNYQGHIGKGSNNSWIVIKSDYSAVRFDQ